MKIDHIIVQYLYNNKKVSLQGIGSIYLDPAVAIPDEGSKDFVIPENAISFEYNLKATEDSALVDFIKEKTKKIRPLAASDLESYTILARQFLNIGKPLEIEGVGTILKNQAGDYEFTPGRFISPKIEETPKELKTKAEEKISFESESKKDNTRRNVMIIAAILVLVLGGLGLYYWLFQHKRAAPDTTEQTEEMVADTTVNTIAADTAQKLIPDSLSGTKLPEPAKTDSNNFRIVIKEYSNLASATKMFNNLTLGGHKIELLTNDSVTYRIVMPFTKPLSDTTRVKDSLRIFFGGKPYILIK